MVLIGRTGWLLVLSTRQMQGRRAMQWPMGFAMTEQPKEGTEPDHPRHAAVVVRDLSLTFPGRSAAPDIHVLERVRVYPGSSS